jgi:hypothetical protein
MKRDGNRETEQKKEEKEKGKQKKLKSYLIIIL